MLTISRRAKQIKDIKSIRPSPLVSKPARADTFFGSLKKASFVELVFPSTDKINSYQNINTH